MKTKTKVAVGLGIATLLWLAGWSLYKATKVKAQGVGVSLQILDARGNLVRLRRRTAGRGLVMAGAVFNLAPGNYTAKVTATNASTVSGSPHAATLTINLQSNIAGLLTAVNDPENFAAGETKVFNYPFTVTGDLIGKSGTLAVAVLDPAGNQLASDSAAVNLIYPNIALGALTATKFYSTKNTAGVAPAGPAAALPLGMGDAFWADLSFQYQYKGGNYTFLAELNMGGGVYLRSFKDLTLPDSTTVATVPLTTANQDVFAPNGLTFGTPIDVRLSLIFRGFGPDWSQWTSVLTQGYSGAYMNAVMDYQPHFNDADVSYPASQSRTGAPVDIFNGLTSAALYGQSYALRFFFMEEYLKVPLGVVTVVMKRPDGTTQTMTYWGSGSGGYQRWYDFIPDWSFSPFNQSGTWNFLATLTYNGAVVDTKSINLVIPPPIQYGATVTIGYHPPRSRRPVPIQGGVLKF